MRPRIRANHQNPMTQTFAYAELKRIVIRDSIRSVEHRIVVKTQIWDPQTHIPAAKRFERLRREQIESVRSRLAVDWIGGGCNSGLVEGDLLYLMHAMVAGIAQSHLHGIEWLPLQIQGPILGVGQLVGGI